jgi:cobalt-zinc-cadmium efflux system protein
LLEDVLGWVAVLIASIAIYFWEIPLLDPILSLAITAFILWNVIKRLKETILIFLQSQPAEIDRKKVEKELLEIAGICSVHHTHIWSLDGERHVFSTHLKLKKETVLEEIATIKQEVKKRLEKFHFEHITLETELEGDPCEFE